MDRPHLRLPFSVDPLLHTHKNAFLIQLKCGRNTWMYSLLPRDSEYRAILVEQQERLGDPQFDVSEALPVWDCCQTRIGS